MKEIVIVIMFFIVGGNWYLLFKNIELILYIIFKVELKIYVSLNI